METTSFSQHIQEPSPQEMLNTALYKKMENEQEYYRSWLLNQPPSEILKHAYEYTVREDIVLSLENRDLSEAQCKALLSSPSPLADVFREFEKRETDYMDTVWDALESRANTLAKLEQEQSRDAR